MNAKHSKTFENGFAAVQFEGDDYSVVTLPSPYTREEDRPLLRTETGEVCQFPTFQAAVYAARAEGGAASK